MKIFFYRFIPISILVYSSVLANASSSNNSPFSRNALNQKFPIGSISASLTPTPPISLNHSVPVNFSSAKNFPDSNNTLVLNPPSDLKNAHDAFEKKDFSKALTLYQSAFKNRTPHENQNFPQASSPVQTPSLTQKIVSFFKGKSAQSQPPQTNPDSKNIVDGYIHLQMGKCYVQQNKMNQAVSEFDTGATAGGDNPTGNLCLFEKGFCHMHQGDYQNAYVSLKEYVKRNVDMDPKDMDQNRMKRAVYMASMCAWKLNKSGADFETDMEGAKALAVKAFALMQSLDKRIYFKK